MKVDKEEWCIVKYYNEYPHLEPEERVGKPPYDLLVRLVYQWGAQNIRGDANVVARGFKTAEEAMHYIKLYKD